jgi:hypothetical protein
MAPIVSRFRRLNGLPEHRYIISPIEAIILSADWAKPCPPPDVQPTVKHDPTSQVPQGGTAF